jgi:hypothetical protein
VIVVDGVLMDRLKKKKKKKKKQKNSHNPQRIVVVCCWEIYYHRQQKIDVFRNPQRFSTTTHKANNKRYLTLL